MKKTIIIVILAVYIASIAVVNFFGLQIVEADHVEYVTGIQCDTVTLRDGSDLELAPSKYLGTTPVFIFDFVPAPSGAEYTSEEASILSNPNCVELNYQVFPHLADDAEVEFEYDEGAMDGIAVFREDIRSLIFLKPDAMFTVTIRAVDGSNVYTTVSIMAKLPAAP